MSRLTVAIVLLPAMFVSTPVFAQVVNPARSSLAENVVGLGAGFESGAVLEAEYGRFMHVPCLPRTLMLGRIVLPFSPDLGDWALNIGAQATRLSHTGWGVQPGLGFELRRVDGPIIDLTQVAVIPSVVLGYFRTSWMMATEASWDRSFLTTFSPDKRYRTETYPGARGGVGFGGGGALRFGLRASLSLGATIDVTLRAGWVTSDRFASVAGLPLYGILAITRHL